MATPKGLKFAAARSSRARSLKSSSAEQIEMSVCKTRSSASYRSVATAGAALWTVPLIAVPGRQSSYSRCDLPRHIRLTTFQTARISRTSASVVMLDLRQARQISVSGSFGSRYSVRRTFAL